MKKSFNISVLFCAIMLCFSLIFTACDTHEANIPDTDTDTNSVDSETETKLVDSESESQTVVYEPETESESQTDSTINNDLTKWTSMLDSSNFENYTLDMEGNMAVIQDGVQLTVNDISETIMITTDKVLVIMRAAAPGETEQETTSILLEDDVAQSQKDQYAWLFLTLLENPENFEYDAAKNTFKLVDDVVIETVMKGFSASSDGEVVIIESPTTLEMRDGEVTVSADGQLVKFVCDYSQTTDTGSGVPTTVSGITTWTFSNYGTTVITESN